MASARDLLDRIAEDYVRLCFYIARYEPGYVEFYYGPAHLRQEAESNPRTLDQIYILTLSLTARLGVFAQDSIDRQSELRRKSLGGQVEAARGKIASLQGTVRAFDEESAQLFGAIAPSYPEGYFKEVAGRIDALLPGSGPVAERLNAFRDGFMVPPERLEGVFQAAIAEARGRTARHVSLPAGESFAVEFVHDKPWIAYNQYQGESRSLVQINADLPAHLDFVSLVACHEGYPGHHVFHCLREKELYRGLGWVEVSISPLHSPLALIAEGLANFGMQVAFPTIQERIEFEGRVLCPLAGLEASKLELYYCISELSQVQWASTAECARRYLGGALTREQAMAWLTDYSLQPAELAENWISFIESYRSYVISYSAGQELVKNHVEKRGGAPDKPDVRWQVYRKLLTQPLLPNDLLA